MEKIIIKGAKTNYLKNINVDIPINKFNCFTGVSGCGKSSLVYDTIFAESQRAFLEGMGGDISGNQIMDKPDVDSIENLRPAIKLSQNHYNNNPRSTVGSVTEITYYLRMLFSILANDIYEEIIPPNEFSPNVTNGCCPKCKGLGTEYVIDIDKIVVDEEKSLDDGAISYYNGSKYSLNKRILMAVCDYYDININEKFKKLSKKQKDLLLYRKEPVMLKIRYKNTSGKTKTQTRYVNGVFAEIESQLQSTDSIPSSGLTDYLKKTACSECLGKRYSQKILNIKFREKDIADLEGMSIKSLSELIDIWKEELSKSIYYIQYEQLFSQIRERIDSLCRLKLEYISLDRSVPTLSGGEMQRVRVATQMNCSLSGLIYILDEPCKGLHMHNVDSIIDATNDLLSKGNTVIAIEHNSKYVEQADNIFELGPVGGSGGGYLQSIRHGKKKYTFKLEFPQTREKNKYITLENVNFHNISKQTFRIPEQAITCVTGVSGAGKSSLVRVLNNCVNNGYPIDCKKFDTTIKKAFYVDQQPIGKNSRSTIVTYLDIFNDIRDLFADTDTAKQMNISASDFSFNVDGGRCDCCLGTGYKRIEMSYLPDSYVLCPECNGNRFKKEICDIKYKDNSITDILKKPINDIIDLFDDKPGIKSKLQCMLDIGLGYLALGDLTSKLSGGESQRVKLAKELGRNSKSNIMYILDEPTSGLHEYDIEKIKNILYKLAEKGNTIVIVEHNISFISSVADAILDFGMKSGEEGGLAVLYNTPQEAFYDEKSSLFGFINEK